MADVDPLMHRSSEKQNVFLWIAFSVGKSTALVVPILPLFFFQERGYSIAYMLSVASFYVLLPVVLDVPMALLGDRFGHKRMLVSGSLFFTMAFLAVAIDLPHAYHLYLIGIGLAASCYSGSEITYLRFLSSSSENFEATLFRATEKVYLASVGLLIFGGMSYAYAPILPIAAQLAMLVIAIAALFLLPRDSPASRQTGAASPRIANRIPAPTIRIHIGVIGLVVLYSGVFNAIMQVNARTISIQLFDGDAAMYAAIGVIFAIGNFFSPAGARLLAVINARVSKDTSLLIAGGVTATASTFLTSDLSWLVVLGFLVLCVAKGYCRPLVSAVFVSMTERSVNKAAAFSLLNVASLCVVALIHFLLAKVFDGLQMMYLYFVVMCLVLMFASLVIRLVRP